MGHVRQDAEAAIDRQGLTRPGIARDMAIHYVVAVTARHCDVRVRAWESLSRAARCATAEAVAEYRAAVQRWIRGR